MPVEGGVDIFLFFRLGILFLAVFYFIFSLIVLRQISLMNETVISDDGPYFRFFGVLHSGLALGVIILLTGMLFG
ncbi:hypothetical protein A2617_01305 [Candidatus Daviesbacteria bacterium RIFOXYD1_FULL_41_10]|uniref:Uncharacterized protein n=2 Tax=Candidatus Daviesiibacteriota TaxID=1752718 RepID=A0A1F5N0P7_9BACT|nr:MAG: hypothetical protein UU67_C0006G0020 [Candidatus Daviesbacteria bacterium GW2011_GWB1_41_5]OGE71060.1 MAG: hypothetical protein A2617_01305 [Candidatus Daviesbacteria bacterium RIFOXYD1_FULL_41_10]